MWLVRHTWNVLSELKYALSVTYTQRFQRLSIKKNTFHYNVFIYYMLKWYESIALKYIIKANSTYFVLLFFYVVTRKIYITYMAHIGGLHHVSVGMTWSRIWSSAESEAKGGRWRWRSILGLDYCRVGDLEILSVNHSIKYIVYCNLLHAYIYIHTYKHT